jgi:hypothetical protein
MRKITLPDYCRWCAQEYLAYRTKSDDVNRATDMLRCVRCHGFRGYCSPELDARLRQGRGKLTTSPTEEDQARAVAVAATIHQPLRIIVEATRREKAAA